MEEEIKITNVEVVAIEKIKDAHYGDVYMLVDAANPANEPSLLVTYKVEVKPPKGMESTWMYVKPIIGGDYESVIITDDDRIIPVSSWFPLMEAIHDLYNKKLYELANKGCEFLTTHVISVDREQKIRHALRDLGNE